MKKTWECCRLFWELILSDTNLIIPYIFAWKNHYWPCTLFCVGCEKPRSSFGLHIWQLYILSDIFQIPCFCASYNFFAEKLSSSYLFFRRTDPRVWCFGNSVLFLVLWNRVLKTRSQLLSLLYMTVTCIIQAMWYISIGITSGLTRHGLHVQYLYI